MGMCVAVPVVQPVFFSLSVITTSPLAARRPDRVGARNDDSLDSKEQQRVAKALRTALGDHVEVSAPPPLLRSELKVWMG